VKIHNLLLALFFGAAGYLVGVLHQAPGEPAAISSDLQQRTESFQPDCAMLVGAANQPLLIRQGDDYYTALSDGERITVWGLSVQGGPASAWWSAQLDNALQQACGG
jgi:hypothetical protein